MSRFLDPKGLVDRSIAHFDAWAATFGEVVESMEISPDGASLRPRSRFAKFTNLPELQQMFRAFSDVQTADMLQLPTPRLQGGKPMIVACPMSDAQRKHQQALVARYDRIRSEKVDPREDNALAITTDGRKLALDARLLSRDAADHPASKLNALVENVIAIWQQTTSTRGTQMVFCDLGVHSTAWGYSVYDEVMGKLTAGGIPPEQIATVGEADSDAKKQALFDRVRRGAVRVLIGSTQKMGTGTNVQRRLAALHHLDAPWKPAEVEQREGRILRQGNENAEVAIFRYVTEGSFDAYMWQALETKARFISQVIRGETGVRQAEDIGGQELSYAEVKAIASGNPAVLTLAEADAELQRLSVLKRSHADEQFIARRNLAALPARIDGLKQRLADLATDCETAHIHQNDSVTIGGRICHPDDVHSVLGSRLETILSTMGHSNHQVELGIYRGLAFGLIVRLSAAPEVLLEGAAVRKLSLVRNYVGPRAVLNAAERIATSYDEACTAVEKELALAESQLRDYQTGIGATFRHEAYMAELTRLRDLLKVALSRIDESKQSNDAADLSQRIQQLRNAHAAETSLGRQLEGPASNADEPVTSRASRNRGVRPNKSPTTTAVATSPAREPTSAATAIRHLGATAACVPKCAVRRPTGDVQQPMLF